ncbi:hypothetical protein B296_00044038 [Ensete ventricosum]|uniref:Uncharacterized protein n=1 Tax=Ensete ventricosum TaxID=4639 RepID=A0A426ZCI4_ENSVE|nr:hypothetical protein B296_00044038 [Ensete ventricosum]
MRRYDRELLGALFRCTTQRQEGRWIQGVNTIVPQRWVFRLCASNLALDESIGHRHMGAVYHRGRRELQSVFPLIKGNCSENTGVLKQVVERGKEATTSSEGLSYPKAKRQLERRWTWRSATAPQRRIYRLRRKGHRCKTTDSRAMGSAAPWYCRGGTSVESSIPRSHGGRALVIKEVEEVENVEANSSYQDRRKGRGQGTS